MEKLCPHCKSWSAWDGHIDDKCQNCDEFLKHHERIQIAELAEKRRKLEFNFKEKFPLTIKETDNIVVKMLKHTAYGVYFVFMSIMVTLLWIIFWLAS